MKIKIATRLSPLAMLQTNEVVKKIKFHDSECTCEIIKIKSDGDLTDLPLHTIGGKGLFAVSYTHLRAHEPPEHLVMRDMV